MEVGISEARPCSGAAGLRLSSQGGEGGCLKS